MSNSITHLVKVVAKEVFYEEFDRPITSPTLKIILDRLDKLESLMNKVEVKPAISNDNHPVYTSAVNAGNFWAGFEDDILKREFNKTVEVLSARHGRTMGSIRERIKVILKGEKE